jgi:hypothetical protein
MLKLEPTILAARPGSGGAGMACWINLLLRAVPQLCRGRCPDHIKIPTCCRCRNYSSLATCIIVSLGVAPF